MTRLEPKKVVELLSNWTWLRFQSSTPLTLDLLIRQLSVVRALDAPIINPLLDLGWIAQEQVGKGDASALDTLIAYASELLPHGLSPHPLIDARLYGLLNPAAGRVPDAWVWHLLNNADQSGRSIIPLLSPSLSQLPGLEGWREVGLGHVFLATHSKLNLSPHPWLDPVFVLSSARRSAPAGTEAVEAYRLYIESTLEGQTVSPSAFFDEAYYLSHHAEARRGIDSGTVISGFHHFIATGEPPVRTTSAGRELYLPPVRPDWWNGRDRQVAFGSAPEAFQKELSDLTANIAQALVHHIVDGDLPNEVYAGEPIDLVIHGIATSPQGSVARTILRIGDIVVEAPFGAFPRADWTAALSPLIAPPDRVFCGFAAPWSGRLPEAGQIGVEISFEVLTEAGSSRSGFFPVGEITVRRRPIRKISAGRAAVQIAMATFNPDPALFEVQIQSIRDQTLTDWRLVISDESPDAAARERIVRLVRNDPRITLISGPRRGFLGNFERALRAVDAKAPYFAFSDQDDRWHADKLETLVEAIEKNGVDLTCCDMTVEREDGTLISPSFWGWRRPHGLTTNEILLANTVTGAAMVASTRLIERALPFPHYSGVYHDMWIALLASRDRGIVAVDRVLQTYVQHAGNVLGHDGDRGDRLAWGKFGFETREAEQAGEELARAFVERTSKGTSAAAIDRWWSVFFTVTAGTNPAMIQRRFLHRALGNRDVSGATPLPALSLARRSDRRYLGIPQWLRAGSRLQTLADGAPALREALARKLVTAVDTLGPDFTTPVGKVAAKFSVHKARRFDATILLPELRPAVLFAGYLAKLNLAKALVERGLSVRLGLIDQKTPNYRDLAEIAANHPDLADTLHRVSICRWGWRDDSLELASDEVLVATTWWSAHLAAALRPGNPFVYLIQEYEPLTVPQGSWSALAEQSYRFSHRAIFSTGILRDYFAAHRIGVFAGQGATAADASFYRPPPNVADAERIRASTEARDVFLCYMRPEPQNARNLYEHLKAALDIAVPKVRAAERSSGRQRPTEFVGVGAQSGTTITVGGEPMRIHARMPIDRYTRLLMNTKAGAALMHAPHPGMVPVDMAVLGIPCLTTEYDTKTNEALGRISPLIVATRPDVDELAEAIVRFCVGSTESLTAEVPLTDAPTEWKFDLDWILAGRGE